MSIRITAVLAIIAAITFICFRLIPVNATSVGFAYLIAILLIATAGGLLEATVASVAAVLCFNYYFLPPIGTFTIADPQNWVALFAFLVTSIIASQLSARAKRRTQEAVDRRLEMERLYALSRAILLTDVTQSPAPILSGPAHQIAHQIAKIFESPAVALYDRNADEVHRSGPWDAPVIEGKLRQAVAEGTTFNDESGPTVVTAICLGGKPVGGLAIRGSALSEVAHQALSNLVAIGLERVRAQDVASRAEAARQSDELKSTLLDAIAHEFKTPLTSIKAASSALLSASARLPEEPRELVTVVDEEADRLGRLVNEAIQMARIEAGKIQLNKRLQSIDDLVHTVLQQMKPKTEGRNITVRMGNDLPMIPADAELVALALRQLLDNAMKYSPPTSPLVISAERAESRVTISVEDQGPGIPEPEQSRVFGRFYRSPKARQHITGTGMGLAIVREILHAHGGEIRLQSSPGQGSKFSISLPAVDQERTE